MSKLKLRRVFDRRKTATKSTEAPVHLELYRDRTRKYFDTGIRLYAGQWSSELALAVKCKEAREINKQLDELEEAFIKVAGEVYDRYGEEYTLDQLVKAYKKQLDRPRSFAAFIWEHYETRSMAEGTRRQHLTVLRTIEESGLFVAFADVTYHSVAKFDAWLRRKKGLRHQVTIHNYHKRLKIYIHAAMACGYIEKDPYQTYKVPRGESKGRRFLGKEELAKIITAEIEDPVLRRIRDLFLFQCYTGLAYADLATFEYKNTEERDGMRYLRAQRHKTNTEYFIYLLPPAIKILEAYDYKIPILCQQKYNVYLKALAIACGLQQKLTSHMARHTFATTVTLANGVPLHILQKMLGHTSVKTTQIYAKTLAEDVQAEFQRLKEIF